MLDVRQILKRAIENESDEVNEFYEYKHNKPLTVQYNDILSNWNKIRNIPVDVNKLIIQYTQYASELNIALTNHLPNSGDDEENTNGCTIRADYPFPLNKGQYSFTVTFTGSKEQTDFLSDGDTLDGLNFVGICSDKYVDFDKYIIYSDKKNIYGFGDDMVARGRVTWRYFGNGAEPKSWHECGKRYEPTYTQPGGFGHNDQVTILIDMEKCWIKGYKNGRRFIRNDIGDIGVHIKESDTKFYPVISVSDTLSVDVTVSYGNLKVCK
eukprot:361730_1